MTKLAVSHPIKTYYYNDGENERIIGNQNAYNTHLEKNALAFEGKKVFTKMTRAKRKIKYN